MSYPESTAREAFDALERYRVIDVREPSEFDGPLGRIEGAELVPLGTIGEHADELAGGALLLVCRSGKRSGKACEALAERGCVDVTNLAGGMIGWNRAGLPVVHDEPESLAALADQIVAWAAQVGPTDAPALRERVRERFASRSFDWDAPSHEAVEDLIGFVGEFLAEADPPDLDLSLTAFRRSLAAL